MLNQLLATGLLFIACFATQAQTNQSTPPFHGTIFLDPDIITPEDPTSFHSLTSAGQEQRQMFDRRVNKWITANAFLFNASFDDGLVAEFQVNAEFGNAAMAESEALQYARVIGQLPMCLRKDIRTVTIHKGVQLFGGGNNNILIHTGQTELYVKDGILEETLVHEATHTSLDAEHASTFEWLRAQQLDRNFISKYAQDNPKREDLSETFLLFMALKIRPDRISEELKETIQNTVYNRLNYLENQEWDFYPLEAREVVMESPKEQEVDQVVEQIVEDPNATMVERAAELEWIPFDGSVPDNYVSGGEENGNELPVCRGQYQGANHAGKLLSNKCNIGWGGKEIELTAFEVLTNTGVPLVWMPYTGNIPEGTVEAGIENGKVIYVGQITRPDGSVHAGKVFGIPGGYIFNYGYGGKEISVKSDFRLLVR